MLCNIKQFVLFRRGKNNTQYIVLKKKLHTCKKKKKKSMQCWTTSSAWTWAKRFPEKEKWWWSCRGWASHQLPVCRFQIKSPSLAQQLFLSVFLKPTSLQTCFFFSAENNWTNARRLRLFILNECFFFFIWNQWYACSNNFYRRSWKATCFGELLLWVVYKDCFIPSLLRIITIRALW